MVDFQYKWGFYLLLLIPVFAIMVFIWYRWQRRWNTYLWREFHEVVFPDIARKKWVIRFLMICVGTLFLIGGIINPRSGLKKEKVKVEGVQIMFCLDISRSMDARDIAPSRLEHAKNIIYQTLRLFPGNAVGLIVYAAGAYLQCPPTIDYSILQILTEMVNTSYAPVQGTSIREALAMALKSFNYELKTTRAIVILTDGEDHEGNIESILPEIKERGVKVIAVGIGTPEGTTIPIIQNNQIVDFKRDRNGNVVTTRLNEDNLLAIVSATDGVYIRSVNPLTTALQIKDIISKFEKGEMEEYVYTQFYSFYPYFIAMAIIFLIAEYLIGETKWKLSQALKKIFRLEHNN